MKIAYNYPATVKAVVDGDTVKVDIDMGWGTWKMNQPIRLSGYDAPERSSKNELEKAASAAVLKFVQSKLPAGLKTMVESHSLDKYGRVLGEIRLPDGKALGEMLLGMKVVKGYKGAKKPAWTDAELQFIIDTLASVK